MSASRMLLRSVAVGGLAAVCSAFRTTRKGLTCEDVWENQACNFQFGQEDCRTCGVRIQGEIDRAGVSDDIAKQRIADKFLLACGPCALLKGDTDLETEGYKVVWSEDFNSPSPLDVDRWRVIDMPWNTNAELQYYSNRTRNVEQSDGTLKLRAFKENYGGRGYTSGKIESYEAFLYGKFSVRGRILGTARGTWPAFWMYPTDPETYGWWPKCGELDVMEHVGMDLGRVHGTVHTGSYNHIFRTDVGGSIVLDVTEWHTYTAEWRENMILWAVDGEVFHIFRKEADDIGVWPFNHEFFWVLNMAIGGDWGGQKGIDEAAFEAGQTLEVDWIKVEQKE